MGMLDRTKERVAAVTMAPEMARTATILGAAALIIAVLALGVALGKVARNAN